MDKNPYQENQQHASENLRLTLSFLSNLKIPLSPLNYRMGYDCIAGTNDTLRTSLENCPDKSDNERTKDIWNIYRRFYVQDHETLDIIRDGLRRIIFDIQGSAEKSGGNLSSYVTSLRSFSSILDSTTSPETIKAEIKKVIQFTQSTELSQRQFETQLTNMATEVETLRKELAQSKQESLKDTLTGIFNRKAFDDALHQAIKLNHNNSNEFCVLIADIDHFKKVNDTYGHVVGDKVIRFVASTLKRCTHEHDLSARIGGEEFAVLLPKKNLSDASSIAEKIRQAVSSGQLKDTQSGKTYGKVTVSIGVAQFHSDDIPEILIQRADDALYQAKGNGRNRVERAAGT